MSNCCLTQSKNFVFKKEKEYYKLQLSLLSQRGLEMISSMGEVLVVASMYPASRIVIKQISCEYTSILDNIIIESLEI